jgi:hypothetical protein
MPVDADLLKGCLSRNPAHLAEEPGSRNMALGGVRPMSKVEMMRVALKELGGATAAELSAFLEKTYNVKVEPKYIPILRASVREKEMLEDFRVTMKALVEAPKAA